MDAHVAHWMAHKAGAIGPLGFIDDAWGGYWQCATVYGPWNFRVTVRSALRSA
jgi:hypothetical protein